MMKSNTQDKQKLQSILIFGAPGSGKGTQGKFLSYIGNHFHFSSGELFRKLSLNSLEGKLCRQYAEQGKLIPDEVVIKVWYSHIVKLIEMHDYLPQKQLLLLDGIPRTLEQAQALEAYIKVKKILLLENHDREILVQRLQKRAMIEKRHDDRSQGVWDKRIQIYERETSLVIQYYSKELIVRVNADQSTLDVLKDILGSMSSVLS